MRDTSYQVSKQTKQKFSQGGEIKVMKKSLSLVLAMAMVFGSFSAMASAAEDTLTAQQKYDALAAKGLFAGKGDKGAALDDNMTRAEFSRVAALLLGLDVTTKPAESKFTDVKLAHWAVEEVHAIEAAKVMEGNGNGTFTPSAEVTVEQVARVLVDALKLEVATDAPAIEGVSAWAYGYVKAAIDNGLIPADSQFQAPAKRSLLVTAAYTAEAALNPGVATSFAAKATGAKKLTVTFNGAVDAAKAKITVWNGTNQVNSKSITFAADNKSAVVEFALDLPAAEYTVKVEGISEKELTSTVKVEAAKVAKITFNSDKAALNRNDNTIVSVGYKVLNQYEEEINSTSLSATAGKGTATASNGSLTLDAAQAFVLGEKVVISLVHTSGTFATTTVEVGSVAQVSTVDIVKLYNANSKELEAGSTENFDLILDLKDQYGASVTDLTYLNNDLIVTVSNTAKANLIGYVATTNTANYYTTTIDGTNHVAFKLQNDTNLTAGTSTVTVISKATGAKDTFDLVVKENIKVDTLTLSAPASAPAGSTVNIPYTAVDQFGAAIKHPKNDMLATGGKPANVDFVKDVVKDVTNLQLDLTGYADGAVVIINIITHTNKVSQLTVNVTKAKVATVISGTKDLTTALHKDGGTAVLNNSNVVVKDQYGNDISPTYGVAVNEYRVKLDSSDSSKVTINGTNTGFAGHTLAAVAKGTSAITLTLQQNLAGVWTDVANSSYTYNAKVVSKEEIVSYTATVDGKVLAGGSSDYAKELKVVGTLEDGSTVTVTNNVYNYAVDTSILPATVHYTDNTPAFGKVSVDAAHAPLAGDPTEAKISLVVIIKGANGQEVKTVEVTTSDVASAPATLAVNATGIATKESDNVISVTEAAINAAGGLTTLINNAVETKDQYGVVIADAYTNYDSNYSSTTRNTAATVDAGDTFNVTVVAAGGITLVLKVIVK